MNRELLQRARDALNASFIRGYEEEQTYLAICAELEKPEPVECGRVEVIKGYPFGLRAIRIFPDGKYRLLAEKIDD
jgi:hypothetical protein